MTERIYLSMFKEEPEILTVVEAARLLRIGKHKTYELVKTGKLGSMKIGGRSLVPKLRLIQFLLNENETETARAQ